HSLLAGGSVPPVSTYTIKVNTKLTNITAFRLEALTDPNLPHGGPGRSTTGNFVLTQFEVDEVTPDGKTNKIELQNATADYSQPGFSITNAIEDKVVKKREKTGWAVEGAPGIANHDRNAVFETRTNIGYPE